MSETLDSDVRFGFVAALEREVAGIVRGWDAGKVGAGEEQRRIYRTRTAALICAGTGASRAYSAAKLLVEECHPKILISMGFAGSCSEQLKAGEVFVPAVVTEFASGRSIATAFGSGQLVTLNSVAGTGLKRSALERFGALAIDMEASGVAAAASGQGLDFVAIKAISDGVDEDLGFLSEFVRPDGFATSRFVAHVAVRPRLWPKVASLQANSALAAKGLQTAVESCMSDWRSFAKKYSSVAAEV